MNKSEQLYEEFRQDAFVSLPKLVSDMERNQPGNDRDRARWLAIVHRLQAKLCESIAAEGAA